VVRRASRLTDPELGKEVEDLARVAGLRGAPGIRVTNHPIAVLTLGAIRPVILISSETLAECAADELRMVLAHEVAHIRRRDAWLGLIPQLTQAVFFFHPMAWLACREFEFFREAACDEAVLSSLQINAGHYGQLLVKLGSPQPSAATLCSPGVSSHFRLLRRRIVMLARTKEGTLLQTHRRPLALTSLIGALCIMPMTLVQGQKPPTTQPPAVAKSTPKPTHKKARVARRSHTTAPSTHSEPARTGTPFIPKEPQAVNVYMLQNADPERTLHLLHTLYGDPASAIVKVAEDERTKALIVTAPQNRAAEVSGLIAKLDITTPDVPPNRREIVRVILLHHGDAVKVIPMVREILQDRAPKYMSADPRENSILVRTTEDNCNEVQNLVNLLEYRTIDSKHP